MQRRHADFARDSNEEELAALLDAALAEPAKQLKFHAVADAACKAIEEVVERASREKEAAEAHSRGLPGLQATSPRVLRAQRGGHAALQQPISCGAHGGSSARPAEFIMTDYGNGALRVFESVAKSVSDLPVRP